MSSQAPQVSEQVQSRYHLTPSTLPRTTAGLYDGKDASGAAVLVRALPEEAFASAAERQRARREIQKLAQVRHPALASVFDSGEEGAVTWYARERVAGETLAARIERKGPLAPGEAAWVAMKVAGALAELHRHGIQHRDVRPERVVLASDGGVKLLDAAVGRVVRLADNRVIPGTPGYVAPEAITGRLVSFRSDLYALGAVLYEMLVGRSTFPVADPARRVQLQVEGDPEALPSALPEPLVRFTASLLSREQRDRPFSAQQVERQLEPFATSPAAESAPPPDADGERTVAFDSPVASNRPSPLGSTPYDDRADDAPTRLSPGLGEVGGRTLVGLDGPAAAASAVAAPPTPSAPAVATGSAPPGGTLNTRLPKMPTLPPIPTGAMRVSAPGIAPSPSGAPAAAAAPPPPAAPAPPRKTTIVGMPMSEMQGGAAALSPAVAPPAAAPPAAPSRPLSLAKPTAGGGLDYDDLGDTTVNDDSRAFGLPGYPPPADAAAAGAPMPPRAATSVGYAVNNGAIAPVAAPSPAASTTPGIGGYDVSSTVMAPAPPGMMQQLGQQPRSAAPAPVAMPEPPPLQPALPPVFGPKPIPYSEYPPMAPRKESNAGMWVAAAFGVMLVAGGGGLAVAKFTGGSNPDPSPAEVTVVPPQPVVAQPDPNGVSAQPGGGSVGEAPAPVPPPEAPGAMQPMEAPQPTPEAQAPSAMPEPTSAPVRVRDPEPRERPARTQPAAQPAARTQPAAQPAARTQPAAQPAARTQPAAQPAAAAARPAPAAAATGPVSAGDPRIAEALRTRNYPQARTLLQGALRSQPNNAGLHAQLGNVFERLGDRNAALNEYRTATRIDRRNTSYLHRLADLQIATGDRAGATATLRQILSITPNDRGAQARLSALGG